MADPTPQPTPDPAPAEVDGRTAGRQLLAWLSEQIRTQYGDLILKAIFGFLIAWLAAQQAKVSQTCDAAKGEAQAASVQAAEAHKEAKKAAARPPVVKWGE